MKLPIPKPEYRVADERERNRQIERADGQNLKSQQDCEIGEGRLILTDTATGTRYQVKITSGVLGIAAV